MRRQFFGARSRQRYYALAHSKTASTSSDSDKAVTLRVQRSFRCRISRPTNRSWIFLGLRPTHFAPVDLADAPPTHWFCAWAPQEDLIS